MITTDTLSSGTNTVTTRPLGAGVVNYQISNSSSFRFGSLRFINSAAEVVFDDDYIETTVSFGANLYANSSGVLSCNIGTAVLVQYTISTFG